jgi:hypothetical protein
MKEFGIAFDDVMAMPIKRFWFMSNMVERLWAEKDLRQIHLMASVGSEEAFKRTHENLRKEMGTVYVWEEPPVGEIVINPETGLDVEFDRAGLHALRTGM